MAKITLSEYKGFTPIPEGKHTFQILEVDYDKDFGVITAVMAIQSGLIHKERFNLIGKDGEINEKALGVFSIFAKSALNDYSLEEIDHEELVECFIEATVKHTVLPHREKPDETVTFVNLSNYAPSEGFKGVEDNKPEEDFNLDEFLS